MVGCNCGGAVGGRGDTGPLVNGIGGEGGDVGANIGGGGGGEGTNIGGGGGEFLGVAWMGSLVVLIRPSTSSAWTKGFPEGRADGGAVMELVKNSSACWG